MTDVIRLLSENVASQIAAGEVVQRPASVVKELLENSVDASATTITLKIKDGGTGYITVIDNGNGMSETDARMCWERHATSKIQKATDLFSIKSFGFRGEAMASIAAVSRVELKTRREDDNVGTHILIEGSNVVTHELCACTKGTQIHVKNLFYNIPARRNFLKSNNVETKHIVEEFNRVALAWPNINFKFYNNESIVYDLNKTDAPKRIADLLNKKVTDILSLKEQTSLLNVSCNLVIPEKAKRTRGEQYFYVNHRFFKSAYLNHALNAAFSDYIERDKFASFVVYLDIDPARIDVNIHPGKTEIKFDDERAVYSIVHAVVKKTLGTHYLFTTKTEDKTDNKSDSVEHNIANSELIKMFQGANKQSNFDPFESTKGAGFKTQNKPNPLIKQDDYRADVNEIPLPSNRNVHLFEKQEKEIIKPDDFFQLNPEFLIFKLNQNLLILDIQKAHQRILFEYFQQQLFGAKSTTQQLLFPKTMELGMADFNLLLDLIPELSKIGFDISEFGKNTIIINGVPAVDIKHEESELIEGLLEQYKHQSHRIKLSKQEKIAKAMARQASIKNDRYLDDAEILKLMADLFDCKQPNKNPWGKQIFKTFNPTDLHEIINPQ